MMSENTYDLKPSKEAYQAVKSDVTPVSAYKELIDNALDNWRRVLDGLDPVTIEIEYHEGGPEEEDEIVIRDDSGGVEEDDLQILFALGQSKKSEIGGSIGAYGVGAKKAIVNLGNKATIKSRHLYAETGFGFSIDEEWLHDDSDWTVDKVEYEDIEKGVTEIRISDLNTPWNKYRENLIEDLSQTYQFFLQEDRMDDMENVSIVVREFDKDDELEDVAEVEPPEPVDWSFTPMDDLFVRRYEGIDLESKEFEATVELNVTVGLMREASAEDAGADIFCQNRQVLSGVQDERAGFGTTSGSNRLGKFSGQHRRLRVIIEFKTEGDATVLPWDAQKSDIDPYNRVSRAAFDWIRRIVKPYYIAAGAYDEIPTTLTRPYSRDNEYSVTEHLDSPYDYSGRKRVTHKPDTDFSDAHKITQRADATAPLRIYSPDSLPDEFEPAYREEFLRLVREDFDIELGEEEELPTDEIPAAEVPEDLTVEKAESVYSEISRKARDHASSESPVREVGQVEWKQTLYDLLFKENLSEDVDFESVETLESEEEEEVDETEVTEWTEGVEEPEETEEPEEVEEDEETEEVEEVKETEEVEEPEEVEGGEEVEVVEEPEEAEETEVVEEGEETETVEGSEAARRSLDLSEEEWATLVDALGLDEDASAEEVRERLFDTVDVLRQLPSA